MKDKAKTKKQLIDELSALRKKIADAEESETGHVRVVKERRISDVTEWKRAEETVRKSEASDRTIFENSMDGILLTSPDGEIYAANPSACKMFMRSEEEICQVGREGLVDAGDPCLPLLLQERREKGKSSGELTFIRKDGTKFPGECSSAIFLDTKGIERTSMTIRDITQQKQTEKLYQEREADLKEAQRLTKIGSWRLLVPSRTLKWSEELYRIFDIEQTEFDDDYESFIKRVYPDDKKRVLEFNKKAIENGKSFDFEYRIITRTGELKYIHELGYAAKDNQGNVTCLFGTAQDMTDLKLAESALRESEERLRAVFEAATDSIFIKDMSGRYVNANPAMARMLGKTISQIIGLTDKELVTKQMLDHIEEEDARVLKGEKVRTEHSFFIKDKILYSETIKVPLYDSMGAIIGLCGIARDMTDSKRIEETLRSVGVYSRNLIETAIDPLVAIGRDGTITDVNVATEKATGCPRDELIGSDFSSYFTDPEAACRGYQHTFLHGEIYDYPLEIRNRNGLITPVFYNARVYRNERGEISGVFAAARDITKIRQAENELSRQARILREFSKRLANVEETERRRLAAVLHDMVGQKLTALGINLGIVQNVTACMDNRSIASRLEDAQTLLQETIESIRNIIAELRPSVLDDFGLGAAIRWYNEVFAKRTGISLTHTEGTDLPRLVSHVEVCLFRIYQEALTNVAKHAGATRVDVSLEELGKTIRMTIRDNGFGFDTVNEENLTGQKGWGLIMMEERAKEVRGHFFIESSPGQGTRITVEVKR